MLDELRKNIDDIRNKIPSFDTNERKEIKKNNKYINETILKLEEIKNQLYSEIIKKKDNFIPIDNMNTIDEMKNKLEILFNNVNYLSDKSCFSILGINKSLYIIKNGDNLTLINEEIKKLINIFNLVSISLSCNDFKYSLSLYKYMEVYFDNLNKDNFNEILKNKFDSLYWECPDLIYHILLCFNGLLNKYKNYFESYVKKKNGIMVYEIEIAKYNELRKKIDESVYLNDYINYQKFLNNELNIFDYVKDSPKRIEIISKFISYDKFKEMNSDEKISFYSDIRNMYNDLLEYKYINKFRYLVSKVLEIYSSKDKYSSDYNIYLKNMRTKEKKRSELCRKLYFIYFKSINNKSVRLSKKCNILNNKLNKLILEIKEIYKDCDYVLFVNDVINKINENSTYYDVIKLYEDNYGFLFDYMKDNDKDDYDDIINYLYGYNNVISKSIYFNDNIDIRKKLEDKYGLFEFEFKIDDDNISLFEKDLEYVNRLSYFEEKNKDLEKIKLIMDINKINND